MSLGVNSSFVTLMRKKKISSHPRFIQKLKRDLKQYYYDEDYYTYIKQFHELQELDFPSSEYFEMYYESLFNTGQNEEALFFGETFFQMLDDDHEDNALHMIMIIRALKNLERYEEVENWFMAMAANPYLGDLDPSVLEKLEKIIQFDITDSSKDENMIQPEFDGNIEKTITEGSVEARLSAVEFIFNKKVEGYVNLISSLYKNEEILMIQSLMVGYLKAMDYNDEPIELNKFGKKFKKYTSEFKAFDKEAKVVKTIEWIEEIGARKFEGNDEKIRQTLEMFMNFSVLWYPYHVPFTPQKIANIFINYIRVLHNELDEKNFHGELADWVFLIQDEIERLNQ